MPKHIGGFRCAYSEPLAQGCLIISRTAAVTQLGKAGVLGSSALRDSDRHYALTEEARAEDAPGATKTLGSLRPGFGTAMFLCGSEAAAERVRARLLDLRRSGELQALYMHRTSLTMGCLTIPVLARLLEVEAVELSRPIEYLDRQRRQERQW